MILGFFGQKAELPNLSLGVGGSGCFAVVLVDIIDDEGIPLDDTMAAILALGFVFGNSILHVGTKSVLTYDHT